MTSPEEELAPSTITSAAGGAYFEAVFVHFLANLRLAGDVNDELAGMGLGRIHNRILGVAAGVPGVTVGELVQILSVTHQNIRIPMKTLIERGYLLARVDDLDRRARRLYATSDGIELVTTLLRGQTARIRRAFDAAGPAAVDGFLRVHDELLDPADRHFVERLRQTIRTADSP